MPATYEELMGRAQSAVGKAYTPAYEEEYRQRMQQRYAQEIPAAQAIREAAMSGQMGAQQRLAAGQGMQQQAVAAASGIGKSPGGIANPMAARFAQQEGSQQAFGTAMQGAQAGQQALEQAREAELNAYMRQVGYGQKMQSEELQRQQMMQRAARQRYELERQLQGRTDAEAQALREGLLNAGQGALGVAGQIMGGG